MTGGLILGSSLSRDGLKMRRRSVGQKKQPTEQRNNFLVLNAVTTHRVPQNVNTIVHVGAKTVRPSQMQLMATKDSSNYDALLTAQLKSLEHEVKVRSQLTSFQNRISNGPNSATAAEGDNMMGILNMTNVDVPKILPINSNFNTIDGRSNLNQDLALDQQTNVWTAHQSQVGDLQHKIVDTKSPLRFSNEIVDNLNYAYPDKKTVTKRNSRRINIEVHISQHK